MTKETGGPAFPRAAFDVNDYCGDGSEGMTLRDYFAARAMQAILTKPESVELTANELANAAYEMADTMMKVRSNT